MSTVTTLDKPPITVERIRAMSTDISVRLRAAETDNERLQRDALFADDESKPAAQAAADAAFAKVEAIQREREALHAAAKELDREETAAEAEARAKDRAVLASKLRPLAEAWFIEAQALAAHFDATKDKLATFQAARAAFNAAMPFTGPGGCVTRDENHALRDTVNLHRAALDDIKRTIYSSGLGDMGVFYEIEKFGGSGGQLREMLERQKSTLDGQLSHLEGGDD